MPPSKDWFSSPTHTLCLTARKTWNSVTSCKLSSFHLHFASDDAEDKSGFKRACSVINEELSPFFKGKELPLSKKTFEGIATWVERRNNRSPRSANDRLSPYILRAVFEALLYSYGRIITPEAPYYSLFNFLTARDIQLRGLKSPKLMFTVLNGGKALGSKVKFATFYFIIDIQGKDETVDANEVYYKVTANIKKTISAHKLGEAGFKANIVGSYYNAFDSINDSFKLLEDAINQAQVNTADRKYAQIGVNIDS
jgi:hypothetical protein